MIFDLFNGLCDGSPPEMKAFNLSAMDILGVGRACPSMPSTPLMFRVAKLDVTYADPMGYCYLTQVY